MGIVDILAWGAFAFFIVFLLRGFNLQMKQRIDEREKKSDKSDD